MCPRSWHLEALCFFKFSKLGRERLKGLGIQCWYKSIRILREGDHGCGCLAWGMENEARQGGDQLDSQSY